MIRNSEYCEFETVMFDIIEFLTTYEQLPCLWDRTHRHFSDRPERLKCEEILAEKLGIHDLRTLKRKIRSVRGAYNTEIRKIKQCLERGDTVYPPKLFWFPTADKFLRVTTDLPYEIYPLNCQKITISNKRKLQKPPRPEHVRTFYVSRPSKQQKYAKYQKPSCLAEESNQEIKFKETTNIYQDYEEIETLEEIEYLDQNSKDGDSSVKFETVDEFDNNEYQNDDSASSISKLKEKSPQNSDLSGIVNCLKEIASENEFITFGRSVGMQLKNMPLDLAIQLQMDIQTHIAKTRLEYLQSNQKSMKSENSGVEVD